MTNEMDRACPVCGGSMAHRTSRAVHCSAACNNQAQTTRRIEERRTAKLGRPCKQCSAEIPTDRQVQTDFCSMKCRRAFRHTNKGRALMRAYLYGMTPDDYDELISQQDHRCAVCGTMEWGGKTGEPHVDHDHKTGQVRGLLCASCNYGLGCFKDEVKRLRAAVDYLDDRRRFQSCLALS